MNFSTVATFVLVNGIFWKLLFFSFFVWALIVARKIQDDSGNRHDFFEIIEDPVTHRMSYIRVGYVVVLIASTYVYIIVCTRDGTTVSDIIQMTLTYTGIFVTGQILNKFSERPAVAPVASERPNAVSLTATATSGPEKPVPPNP